MDSALIEPSEERGIDFEQTAALPMCEGGTRPPR
jgi:hypothetical protein